MWLKKPKTARFKNQNMQCVCFIHFFVFKINYFQSFWTKFRFNIPTEIQHHRHMVFVPISVERPKRCGRTALGQKELSTKTNRKSKCDHFSESNAFIQLNNLLSVSSTFILCESPSQPQSLSLSPSLTIFLKSGNRSNFPFFVLQNIWNCTVFSLCVWRFWFRQTNRAIKKHTTCTHTLA